MSTDEIESELTGGIIADWYENSKFIHLIYLIIYENHRRKGIAGKLINEGVIWMKKWIKKERGIEHRARPSLGCRFPNAPLVQRDGTETFGQHVADLDLNGPSRHPGAHEKYARRVVHRHLARSEPERS